MLKNVFITLLLLFLLNFASAQDAITLLNQGKDLNVMYRNQMSGGLIIHSAGFGLNYRRGYHVTGFKTRILELELVNMNYYKEYKIKDTFHENSKGYYYGKLNSLFILRPGIGFQKIIFEKAERKSLEIRFSYYAGISLGLAKPIYMQIRDPNDNLKFNVEKYDPTKDSLSNIYGPAPFLKGFIETKIYPGAYAKFAISFEYGDLKNDIKAIETGVIIDAYPKTIPVMAFSKNQPVFVTLYLHLLYGKKWF